MKRFTADCMTVEFNQSMIASAVTTTDSNSDILVTALFRAHDDFGALIWDTEEQRQHKDIAYPTDDDYSGTVLSFNASFGGAICSYSDTAQYPSITIEGKNGTYYQTLGFCGEKLSASMSANFDDGDVSFPRPFIAWGSVVVSAGSSRFSEGADYVVDYLQGTIGVVGGSAIEYGTTVSVSYQYHSTSKYVIDFDNLKQGVHPGSATPIPCKGIRKVMFPIMPAFYDKENPTHTGVSVKGTVHFTNWSISGGDLSRNIEYPPATDHNRYKICEGYDDEYYRNPRRLIRGLQALGYTGAINLYIGASHYYDFYGIEGSEKTLDNQVMITNDDGLNAASREWLHYFFKEAAAAGFAKITVSVSMESLHIPNEWQQKMFDGSPGRTGWEPPTYFYSPTNEAVKQRFRQIIKTLIGMVDLTQVAPVIQLGEPWWWWQEFVPGDVNTPYPGRPPCFYDDATKALFLNENGYPLPLFETSEIDMEVYEDVILWLRDKLGAFSDFCKQVAKENGAQFTVLFFPPSVLETTRVPRAMRTVNVPQTWHYPGLDFIQIEDYDWLILENSHHDNIYKFATDYFGYPTLQVEYFAGFAWDKYMVSKQKTAIKYRAMTEDGVILNAEDGAYIAIETDNHFSYNYIVLDTEDYIPGDILYIINNGNAGMEALYVNKDGGTTSLINWVPSGSMIRCECHGFTEENEWSYTVAESLEYDGHVNDQPIPLDYQWGLIENAARHALIAGIQNVYFWAGTQVRRDSFSPSLLWHRLKNIYIEEKTFEHGSELHKTTLYGELDDEIYEIKYGMEETGWHEKGRYK